jgi:hypothetical protein
MDDMEKQDPNVERIAATLRGSERLSDRFEERLMSEVRREVLAGGATTARERSWWTAPRSINLTPLASLVVATAFAAVVALSTLVLAGPRGNVPQVATASDVDTVHIVRFVFLDSTATRISVVGDFNGWTPDETPLVARDGTGMWTASIALAPGQHEYAFIVDGVRWAADPFALTTTDEFGTQSSRVAVGSADIKTVN